MNCPSNQRIVDADGYSVHSEQHQIKKDAREAAIASLRKAFELMEDASVMTEEAIASSQNYYRLSCEYTAARATQDALQHVLYTTRRMVNAILDHGAPVNLNPTPPTEHHI